MSAPQEFFDEARAAFRVAVGPGVAIRRLAIAGRTVECRFASVALAERMLESLRHLPEVETPPDLVIEAFDDESSGATMPPAPWDVDQIGAMGVVRDFRSESVRIVFETAFGSLSMIDLAVDVGVFWIPSVRQLQYRQSSFPFRQILAWWFAPRAGALAHVAAVQRTPGRPAALLPGRGGRGKSSTALSCLIAGYGYLGDDFCVLTTPAAAGTGWVHPLFSVAKLWDSGLERLPELRRGVLNDPTPDDPKFAVSLARCFPEGVASIGAPVGAVLVPERVESRTSSVQACSPAVALRALAPSTMLALADADGAILRRLAAVVRDVPCHRLLLGTDRDHVVETVASLLP